MIERHFDPIYTDMNKDRFSSVLIAIEYKMDIIIELLQLNTSADH